VVKESDPTVKELRKIFKDNELEFFVKKQKGNIVKVHFVVQHESNLHDT